MKSTAWAGALAGILLAAPALAAAPQPSRPVSPGMYAGRWYQIAQIAKTNHHPCADATEDFTPGARTGFSLVISCRVRPGKERQTRVKGAILPNSAGAKFKVGFFGGLISQEYWVLDHAADGSWALMATPGGNYLWLLARQPVLSPGARAAALARIAALGYDSGRLVPDR